MVIPAVMLVILALVVIRSLMGVVAREDVSAPLSLAAAPTPALGVWGDDARSFLLPATADHIDLEHSHDVEANAS
jgi:hypothetical protein